MSDNESLNGVRGFDLASSSLINMSTGPIHVSEHVLHSQSAAVLTSHHEGFRALYSQTRGQIAQIVGTGSELLITHGSIRGGLDLVFANLCPLGLRVLAITNGYWGDYLAQQAELHGAQLTIARFAEHVPVPVGSLGEFLEGREPYDLVVCVHVETSTGIVNDIGRIGAAVRSTGAVFCVDTACSAGAMPVDLDANSVDISVTGAHKTFGGLPGLCIITMNERAWALYDRRQVERPRGQQNLRYQFDVNLKDNIVPKYTQPTSLVLALRAATREILELGTKGWFGHHMKAGQTLRAQLRSAGFEIAGDCRRIEDGLDAEFGLSNTVIPVSLPPRIDDAAFRALLSGEFGVFILGNVGDQASKSVRIGLMNSMQTRPTSLLATIGAMCGARDRLAQATRN